MIIYQYHLLSKVSTHYKISPKLITAKKPHSSGGIYRWKCLQSRKGGKRPWGDTSDAYRNPCHLNSISNNTKNDISNEYYPSSPCVSSSFTSSKSNNETPSTDPFIPATRDCPHAQLDLCSFTHPCTPCELSRGLEFRNSRQHVWSRCQTCSAANSFGECDFIDGIGPYCWKSSFSWDVVPCVKCCTDGTPMFDKGVCY